MIVLERMKIPYLTVGSMATISLGNLRFTNDIDVVIDLRQAQISEFCNSFPAPEYYLSRPRGGVGSFTKISVQHHSSFIRAQDRLHPSGEVRIRVGQMMHGVRQPILENRTAVFGARKMSLSKSWSITRRRLGQTSS